MRASENLSTYQTFLRFTYQSYHFSPFYPFENFAEKLSELDLHTPTTTEGESSVEEEEVLYFEEYSDPEEQVEEEDTEEEFEEALEEVTEEVTITLDTLFTTQYSDQEEEEDLLPITPLL